MEFTSLKNVESLATKYFVLHIDIDRTNIFSLKVVLSQIFPANAYLYTRKEAQTHTEN